jgi:hypothetical protein
MTQPDQESPPLDCLYATICGFLIPFFLAGAGGSREAARAAILELINAYHPATVTELDLVGRIVGFSIVAMDNLRLSMEDGLSAAKVLRYRSNAVSLSRASEQARAILTAIQAKRDTAAQIPRPTIAAANTPAAVLAPPDPAPPSLAPSATAPRLAIPVGPAIASLGEAPPMDIEAMKRDARLMMAAFSKHGAQASTAIAAIPGAATFARA